jgi:hypothetical protein
LDLFSTYYQRLPLQLHNENGLYRLFEGTMDCLISSNYDRAFRRLKANTESMTTEQKFFLIKCPSFLSSYHGKIFFRIKNILFYLSQESNQIKSSNNY